MRLPFSFINATSDQLSASSVKKSIILLRTGSLYFMDLTQMSHAIGFGQLGSNVHACCGVGNSVVAVTLDTINPDNLLVSNKTFNIGTTATVSDFGGPAVLFNFRAANASTGIRGYSINGMRSSGSEVNESTAGDGINTDTLVKVSNYINFSTNGFVNSFGNAVGDDKRGKSLSANNSIIAVIAGGHGEPPLNKRVWDYTRTTMFHVALTTTANYSLFGDLTSKRAGVGGYSSETKGFFAGGVDSNGFETQSTRFYIDSVESIVFATSGSSSDFGSITFPRNSFSTSSKLHGVSMGVDTTSGSTSASATWSSVKDLTTLGTATVGGRLVSKNNEVVSLTSNCHGGL